MLDIKVGQKVIRHVAGIEHALFAIKIENGIAKCGPKPESTWGWDFDMSTGAEVDAYFNWGPPPLLTGSYILLD